jgi:hypothetical protein
VIVALVLAAVLAVAAAYLFAGWRIAMSQLPRAWETARQTWYAEDNIRSSVREQTWCMAFFWPLIMPSRVLSRRMDARIDRGDPVALARKVADRDRRIAQLERELGIKP